MISYRSDALFYFAMEKILVLFFMLASCFSLANEEVGFYPGNSTDMAVFEGVRGHPSEIESALKEQGLDNLTFNGEDRKDLERINSIFSNAVKDNDRYRLALQDFRNSSQLDDVFYDEGGLHAADHLIDEALYDDPELLQTVNEALKQGFSFLSLVYFQYSTWWHLYNSVGDFYQVLKDRLTAMRQQPVQTIAKKSDQSSFLNCFFSGSKSQCYHPEMLSYAISGISMAWLLYTSYRLLYVYRDLNVPSAAFVAVTLALGTLTSAWWGESNSIYAILAVQALRGYFLVSGHHRELFSSNKLVRILLASYYVSSVLSSIDNLRNIGYWSAFRKANWPAYYFCTTLAVTSVLAYIRNIRIPEAMLVTVGVSTSAYLVTAFAALYGAQNMQIEHWHLLLVYGGMIINSMIESAGMYNVIPQLTQQSVIALRYAYSLTTPVPDVVEGFDPVYFMVMSIVVPVFYLLNVPVL